MGSNHISIDQVKGKALKAISDTIKQVGSGLFGTELGSFMNHYTGGSTEVLDQLIYQKNSIICSRPMMWPSP